MEERTALTVSDILFIHMITASRRRQKAVTVSLLSTSLSFEEELSTPMSYNLASSWLSILERNGSAAGRRETRWAYDLREPHSLLYLSEKFYFNRWHDQE